MPPPPLPTRSAHGPPPLPGLPGGADPRNFTADAARISTRDVKRATGRTEGVWVQFDSENVEMAKVEPEYDLNGKKTGVGLITIQFLNGSQYEYANRPMGDWLDLVESSSKGRFSYYTVRGPGKSHAGMGLWKPCRQIRAATRTPAEVAALVARRQPRTAAQKRRTFTRGGKRGAYGAGGARVRPAVG